MNLSGSTFVDLTDVPGDKARMRVYRALIETPRGAWVVIHVGPLAANPEVLQVIWGNGRHVAIEITGPAFAARRWLEAARAGLGVIA